MFSHVKQMLNAPLLISVGPGVNGHGTQHIPGIKEEKLHKPVLHRCKARVSVQQYDTVLQRLPAGKFPAQDIQYLLGRDIMLFNILLKPAVDHLQVLQLLLQKGTISLLHHLSEHGRSDPILVKLGYLGFQLIDKSGLFQMVAVHAKLFSLYACHLADDHGFAHIIQDHGKMDPQVLEYPVGQTLKA